MWCATENLPAETQQQEEEKNGFSPYDTELRTAVDPFVAGVLSFSLCQIAR